MVLVYSDNKNLTLELLNKVIELAKELKNRLPQSSLARMIFLKILLPMVQIKLLLQRLISISLKSKSIQIF